MHQDSTSGLADNTPVPKKSKKKQQPRRPKRPRKSDAWDKEFGRRLSNARGDISQEDMAEILGVPLNTYQKWERGDRTFPKNLIKAVVIKTGHGPWLLLTGEPDYLCPAYAATTPPPPRAPGPVVRPTAIQ